MPRGAGCIIRLDAAHMVKGLSHATSNHRNHIGVPAPAIAGASGGDRRGNLWQAAVLGNLQVAWTPILARVLERIKNIEVAAGELPRPAEAHQATGFQVMK